MIAAGIVLAALAAIAYAVGATLQHDAVHAVAAAGPVRVHAGLGVGQLRALLSRRRWLGGLLAIGTGAVLHSGSLALAPLVIVQPIGVVAIGLAVLMSGAVPSRSTVLAVLASTVGVALFVLLTAPGASTAAVPTSSGAKVLPLVGCVVTGLVLFALAAKGRARSPLFAAAAGVAYGTVSMLTRAIASHLRVTGPHSVPIGPLLGIGAGVLVGAVCVQQAYAGGRPDTVLASQTVVDPLVGVLLGVFLFHELPTASTGTVIGQVCSAALAVAGVVALARRPARPESRSTDTPTESPMPALTLLPAAAPDRPLRIVIGTDTFPPDINGAARFANQLATGMAGRGHDVHVICPSDTGVRRDERSDGMTVHRLPAHRTPFHPTFRICLPVRTSAAVRDLLDRLAPDLVHVQAHFLVGRAVIRRAALADIPVVATNHFMPENLFGHLRVPGWLRRPVADRAWRDLAAVLRPAQVVTAPTPTAVGMLREHGVGGRTLAVSCGVDLARMRVGRRPADPPTVLFVGRLDEEKRVHELLRAVAMLPTRDLAVDVVGDGSCRDALTELAARLGIADRVRFRGFVGEAELVDAYERCSAFCMPGVAELQSLATMEAMAAGKPVIAADAVALPHLVRSGVNGWLYPPGDVPALADRIERLFAEPGALARMGAASRDLIGAHDVRASLDVFESLYAVALGDRVRASAGHSVAA